MIKVQLDSDISLACQWINKDLCYAGKPILIFLHEGLGSMAQWRDFPEKLSQQLNLPALVYDRYGHGLSTGLTEPRKNDYLHREAEFFLPALLKKLNIEQRKIILIGHSDGASIALIHAALFSKNIEAVVAIAPHVIVEKMSLKGIKSAQERYLTDESFKKSLEKYHFEHTDRLFRAWSETWLNPGFARWQILDLLPRIKAPVLAIQGQNDAYGTEKQLNYIVELTNSSYKKKQLIPQCGHLPHIESPDILIEEIMIFLKPILNL